MDTTFLAAALAMLLVAMMLVALPLYGAPGERFVGFAGLPLLVTLVLAVSAIALYTLLGRPDFATQAQTSGPSVAGAMTVATPNRNAGTVQSLLAGLEERLELDPNDGKGWLLLARSYEHLGRTADAGEAYEKARQLGQTDAALGAVRTDHSRRVPMSINGRVRLTKQARDQVSPGDTVFVIATSGDGNPMPLAVLRRSADDLPFDFTLDDTHSMVKGGGISGASALWVTAKISATGDALATSVALSTPRVMVHPSDASPVVLVIDGANGATNGMTDVRAAGNRAEMQTEDSP